MSLPPLPALVALSAVAACIGTVGGLGGAVLLVPALVLADVDPVVAAPLGLLSVAAGSLAAAPRQLVEGTVHHRLGVTLEITASAAAVVGASVAADVGADGLRLLLAAVALGTAVVGLRTRGVRNRPDPTFAEELPGEWPGTLGGAYRLGDDVVPYRARNVGSGVAAMVAAGLVAGLAGTSGGFVKTPVTNLLLGVPLRVAAATTTFTVGITATAGLAVHAAQGRVEPVAGAAIIAGGLIGGRAGAALQPRLDPQRLRTGLSVVLLLIAVILVAGA